MTWFYILFLIVFGLLILKTIISWIFGDIDVDFDFDGDIDFDISSMFSFKGFLHFLFGFSAYLSILAKINQIYLTTNFEWYHYIIAFIIGVLFMYVLWYLYKLMMKFNHSTSENPDFSGYDCTLLVNVGDGYYTVLIKTVVGTFKKTLRHKNNIPNLKIGSQMRIGKDLTNNEYIII